MRRSARGWVRPSRVAWIAALAGTAVLAGGARAIPLVAALGGQPLHALHWALYGYDRVWYRHRTYVDPATESLARLEAAYGPLVPTGERVVGLPVLSPKAAVRSPFTPTVLILRENAREALVYVLSGGP
jgi:hypothetical protein